MDWLDIKSEIDQHLRKLYSSPGVLAEPTRLATELVIIGTHKINMVELAVELNHLAETRKSETYYKLMENSTVSRAREECRMDKQYLQAKKNSEYVTAYLKEVGSLVSTVQTYLKWKGQETSL